MEELMKFVQGLNELTSNTGMIAVSWDCTPCMLITADPDVSTKYLRWDRTKKKYVVSDKPTVKEVAITK